jgi:hypothetical protein
LVTDAFSINLRSLEALKIALSFLEIMLWL